MTTAGRQPKGVHLVGSVPLANAEEVFRTASTVLGDRLRRIPDGETGERTNWIRWQHKVLASRSQFEEVPLAQPYPPVSRLKLRPGASAEEITFGRLGYADAAKASYATFTRLTQAGELSARYRFQVSLPTPLAPIATYLVPEAQAAVEPVYEARLLAEVDEIVAAIPHDQLAIQWDVAPELAIWEGVYPSPFTDARRGIVDRLIRLGNRIPAEVELGYHLCYGDSGHRHFKEPADTANLVEITNAIWAGVNRPIQWLHLPVPRDRSDDAYFAPLRDLRLPAETELYLGLVHLTDGVEGTRQRSVTAQRVVADFGVATECGFGRRPPETIPELLRIHAEVAGPIRN